MPDSELLRENELTLGSRAELQLESLFIEVPRVLKSWGRGADPEVTPPGSPCNATITRNAVTCNGLSFDFYYLEP